MPDTTIVTRVATLHCREDGTVEVHFKPGVKVTVAGVEEVLDARERICGKGAHSVLVTLPEELDFDLDVLMKDHYKERELHLCTYAVAWDAGSTMNETLVELFYRYFPQQFPARAFTTEKEAREWLRAQAKP
jgi:hypothetical protein